MRAVALSHHRRRRRRRSGVVAETAPEGVRLLHEREAGDDFGYLPEVLLVLHLFRRLAFDDDHRPYQLMVLRAPIDLADDRVDFPPGLIGLDDSRRIEGAGVLDGLGPQRELHVGVLGTPFGP